VEGLLLAQALDPLQARLTRGDTPPVAWRFPDVDTLVLQPHGWASALWIDLRPPHPQVALLERPHQVATRAPTGFQALLAARAQGALLAAEQAALDRRFTLRFAAGSGFVPTPAVRLHVELTGRNANAILTDESGVILGAWRDIGREVNRYREIRPGINYRPPPPYQKPDPRAVTARDLAALLAGVRLRDVPRTLDGIGPRLAAAWAGLAGIEPDAPLTSVELPAVERALRDLLVDPAAALTGSVDLSRGRASRVREVTLARLRTLLDARLLRARRQLEDADAALARADTWPRLRAEATLLMAYPHQVPRGAERAALIGFDGEPVVLELDPQLSAVANAERRFASARRQEARAERALERYPGLEREVIAAEAERARIEGLPDAELHGLLRALEPEVVKGRAARVGVWLQGPHGFEVVIGRNARENEAVTFGVGRSLDIWLHAQGVTGSHVIIRSGGREVPAETLRFAAELAAGQAQVAGEGTALVDYTARKHVWKGKGLPVGSVHYAHQRTLAVTPRRISDAAREDGSVGGESPPREA
jgi:predicted ribosome quality control (RQC) complex YloA/Tae2 family protein